MFLATLNSLMKFLLLGEVVANRYEEFIKPLVMLSGFVIVFSLAGRDEGLF